MRRLMMAGVLLALVACSGEDEHTAAQRERTAADAVIDGQVADALAMVGLKPEFLALPKVGRPVSTPARLGIVDQALADPISMIGLSRRLRDLDSSASGVTILVQALDTLGLSVALRDTPPDLSQPADQSWQLLEQGMPSMAEPVGHWTSDQALMRIVRYLLVQMAGLQSEYLAGGMRANAGQFARIGTSLAASIEPRAGLGIGRWLNPAIYHELGKPEAIRPLAQRLVNLAADVEYLLGPLQAGSTLSLPVEIQTPLGKVRIAGTGNDEHSGDFVLLIDLGGDDHYRDVAAPGVAGGGLLVIDLGGDDFIEWRHRPGPGAGVLGTSVWIDRSGRDHYSGNSLGLGVGLLGAGLLWDMGGSDLYEGSSMVQGAGQYGLGILIDGHGVDTYEAHLNGQGFGGPGGYGLLIDQQGTDSYYCGGQAPDTSPQRRKRHKSRHFVSFCQGYGLGRRDDISGGVGLLLEMDGADKYEADLFAQGGAYWFGLGLLVDSHGDDLYEAFEHAQGESLHLGVGVLTDWHGTDTYKGFEHVQGVGIDRAAGILFDALGDDNYHANRESQGAGIKPYGEGLLIDSSGDDRYRAVFAAQGYAREPVKFAPEMWPLGILIDVEGIDIYELEAGRPLDDFSWVVNQQGLRQDLDARYSVRR